jgi:hypothetical protein
MYVPRVNFHVEFMRDAISTENEKKRKQGADSHVRMNIA